jgi:hypothetical protein
MMDRPEPPFTYLVDCSEEGLQNFVLKQQEIAANLRKEIMAAVDRTIDARVNAEIGTLLMYRGVELSEIASARQGRLLRFETPKDARKRA